MKEKTEKDIKQLVEELENVTIRKQELREGLSEVMHNILSYVPLSQDEIARILGVSQTAVYSWKHKKKMPPNDKILRAVELYKIAREAESKDKVAWKITIFKKVDI